jgi:hypothetical protein
MRSRAGTVSVAVLCAIAILLLAAGSLLPVQPVASDDAGPGVDGYPQRIGHQWLIRGLPDRPGPVAALAETVTEHESWDEFDGWYAVSEHGHRWRLPAARGGGDHHPTLSPDGRHLGYLASDNGPYVIHNLITGKRTEFADVGSNLGAATSRYIADGQHPSFWSTDRTRVLFGASPRVTPAGGALVLGVDGSLTQVSPPAAMLGARPAGFVGDDAVAWFTRPLERKDASPIPVTVTVTGLDGEVIRTVMLRPSAPWEGDFPGQWSATVSPDGREILVLTESTFGDGVVRRFSLTDGTETTPLVQVSDLNMPCGAGWARSAPTVPVANFTGDDATTSKITGSRGSLVTVIQPGVATRCLVWAADALTGQPHDGLLGTSTAWWTWWWREILLSLALAAFVTWLYVRWQRKGTREMEELAAAKRRG